MNFGYEIHRRPGDSYFSYNVTTDCTGGCQEKFFLINIRIFKSLSLICYAFEAKNGNREFLLT